MSKENANLILESLRRLGGHGDTPAPFAALVVDAWQSHPSVFALGSFPEHPDASMIAEEIDRYLVPAGLVRREENGEIGLTPAGRLASEPPADSTGLNGDLHLEPLRKSLDRVSEREWEILAARFGFSELRTLAEVGEAFNVSRERVRQIQASGLSHLHHILAGDRAILQNWNEQALDVLADSSLPVDLNDAKNQLLAPMNGEIAADADSRLFNQLFIGLRSLVASTRHHDLAIASLPMLTYLACAVAPVIDDHSSVAAWFAQQHEDERNWRYEELALAVLRQEGKPLHWQEIGARAADLNRKNNCSSHSLHNAMMYKPGVFARTDAGTYGLVEWGLQNVEFYPDIIAGVLLRTGAPMTSEEIIQETLSQRTGNPLSIKMFIDTSVRFYKSITGLYGLRAWLESWDQGEITTPREFVETPVSQHRVERQVKHGYHLDAVLAPDRVAAMSE